MNRAEGIVVIVRAMPLQRLIQSMGYKGSGRLTGNAAWCKRLGVVAGLCLTMHDTSSVCAVAGDVTRFSK